MTDKTILIPAIEPDKEEQEDSQVENEEIVYLLDSCSDVGISRKINQDACCVRIMKTPLHTIVLALVCDGVGGMEEGEYASKSTVQAFNNWFDYRLGALVLEKEEEQTELMPLLSEEINRLIDEQHQAVLAYSRKKGIQTGTTLTAMLFTDSKYLIAQIGDSRAYCVKDGLFQLTEDQSLVAREVREGRLTEEEARFDKRRNIILQCLGATDKLVPVYQNGTIQKDASYFLCSDGFVHKFSKEELEIIMNPSGINDRDKMHRRLLENIEILKERGEKDNITVVWIRTMIEEFKRNNNSFIERQTTAK